MFVHDEEIQNQLRKKYGKEFLILLVPQGAMKPCSCDVAADGGETKAYVADLSVEQYRDKYEPGMSVKRIAEWCNDGEFPSTVDAAGAIVPGAYKGKQGWRITLAGMEERQRRARQAWVSRSSDGAACIGDTASKEPAATKPPTAAKSPPKDLGPQMSAPNGAGTPTKSTRRPKASKSASEPRTARGATQRSDVGDVTRRARQGAWKDDLKRAS